MKYRRCSGCLVCADCGVTKQIKSKEDCSCGGKMVREGGDCNKKFYVFTNSNKTLLFVSGSHSHNRTPPIHRVNQQCKTSIYQNLTSKPSLKPSQLDFYHPVLNNKDRTHKIVSSIKKEFFDDNDIISISQLESRMYEDFQHNDRLYNISFEKWLFPLIRSIYNSIDGTAILVSPPIKFHLLDQVKSLHLDVQYSKGGFHHLSGVGF
jgi:hypothetical protein